MKEARVILNRLLEKYENSKHLLEPNVSKRRVMLRIDKKELPEYLYEDALIRDAYNIAATELEQKGFVQLEWARKQVVLSAIILNLDKIMPCYEQTGRVHPRIRAERVASLVSDSLANTPVPWIAAWRDAVREEAQSRMRVPSFCEVEDDRFLRDLILAFQRYAELPARVTMRAFSSQCYHDTKHFERTVQKDFLRIARKHCTGLVEACAERELSERDQLAFLGIYARPELYELSGSCAIQTALGRLDVSAAAPYGLAIPSTLVDSITGIALDGIRRITLIENKTNYDEYLLSEKQQDELVIYHGGFLSPQKKKFLWKLADAADETVEMRFWADIDLGGFCMFEHLQAMLPQVKPMRMSGLYVEQYHQKGLPRSEEYLTKLKQDMQNGLHLLFSDAIKAILLYRVTVEQEAFLD